MYDKMKFHYQSDEIREEYKILHEIYLKMADAESKSIFVDRLLFSITDEWKYVKCLLKDSGVRTRIDQKLESYKNIEMYIYGAGISGSRIPILYNEYDWKGYIDINKKGGGCNGLPIYGMEICNQLPEKMILITNLQGADKIKRDLMRAGIRKENIVILADYIKKVACKIYFEDFINVGDLKDQYFVDCGAYNGEDTMKFARWLDNKNVKAYVYEADIDNYRTTMNNLSEYHNVKIINKGISDTVEEQLFNSGKGEMSSFSERGDEKIKMTTLDNEIGNQRIGYIKMDIEGFEKEALIGGKKIISDQKPILAVSIYHKREDIWEIPKIILQMNHDYKFYMRHYSLGTVDTVLYAISKNKKWE